MVFFELKIVDCSKGNGSKNARLSFMDILAACPLLTVTNNEATTYSGFIVADKEQFQIQIQLRRAGDLNDARIDCEWRLKELIEQDKAIIEQRLKQCGSLADFLTEFKTIIENRMRSRKESDKFVLLPEFYSALINEIEELGWNRLSFINASFQELHLVSEDNRQRQHTLKIRLHSQHPERPPECLAELPQPFDFSWNSRSKLIHLSAHFEKCLTNYLDFWDVMDEIDANTCVLEPEKPSRDATRRRIALGKASSLQIDVDPRHPHSIPNICFLGADNVTGPLKENFSKNLFMWNINMSLLKNLQTVLEIEFPSLKNSKKEDFTVECGICYSYRFEDEIPDQSCEDKRCAQVFHRACLYEWLHSLSTSRQSFNLLFGECPLCNSPITVKIIS